MKLKLILGLSILSVLNVNAAVYKFKVTNAKQDNKVTIVFCASNLTKDITFDNEGMATLKIDNFKPQYALIKTNHGLKELFLSPSDDMVISFNAEALYKAISFQGKGADVNTYLNSGNILTLSGAKTKLKEADFIKAADSVMTKNSEILKSQKFSQNFKNLESKRLKLSSYALLLSYPMYYTYYTKDTTYVPSAKFYEKVKSIVPFDSELLALPEYQELLPAAISLLQNENESDTKYSNEAEKNVAFTLANVKDEKLVSFLVNNVAYSQVDRNGLDDTDKVIEAFNKYVKDPTLIKKFDEICAKWINLKRGIQSPSFDYLDINGKHVTLESLKGKYVYIDVWATWCGPCKGELPYLKKLEEKYSGKDIYFVSISCDKNKKSWEDMVKKDDLKGIQLHFGNNNTFLDYYMVNGIPRFILLDKDGKIISANMTRPSNKATSEKFDELLK